MAPFESFNVSLISEVDTGLGLKYKKAQIRPWFSLNPQNPMTSPTTDTASENHSVSFEVEICCHWSSCRLQDLETMAHCQRPLCNLLTAGF